MPKIKQDTIKDLASLLHSSVSTQHLSRCWSYTLRRPPLVSENLDFTHSDETLSFFVDYFGRRKDFKIIDDLVTRNLHVAGFKCFQSLANRFIKAGRPTHVVGLFVMMERDYGFKKDKASLKVIFKALCVNGYASYAEIMVNSLARGWCRDNKLDEPRRLIEEMYREGFEIGTEETDKVLVDQEVNGARRNVETFNVMIDNICKLRKTQEALDLYDRMGEWECYPNAENGVRLTLSINRVDNH
ncbi:hypothetical protein ACFE04_006803 [Oxalis oulophora]